MAQLRLDFDRYTAEDAEIIVVGPENAAAFKTFWQENDLPFRGLPDPKYSVLKRYGQEVNLFKLGRMPAQVLIDKNGTARFAHYGKSMSDIPENDELLDILRQINQETDDPSALSARAHLDMITKADKEQAVTN